jgi:F0F1-type ATP synthase membrane subunit b/b'
MTPEFWVLASFLLFIGFIIIKFKKPLLHILEQYQEDIETHLLEHKRHLRDAKTTLKFAEERIDDLPKHLAKLTELFEDQKKALKETQTKKIQEITHKLLMKEQASLNQVRSLYSSRVEKVIVSSILDVIEKQASETIDHNVQKDLFRIFAVPLK